jgi:acyl-CoA thioesterase-1
LAGVAGAIVIVLGLFASAAMAAPARTIVALGDSLTAGYGLAADEAFPARLEAALKARGHDVVVVNGGVSGDTASDGLARLDWSVAPDADAVIIELGANDALRGVDPAITRQALDDLMASLAKRRLPVLLAGMRAPPNLGREYTTAFDGIYADLADRYGALLYPFFLDGVAAQAKLNQPDGIHPTAAGVDIIVERMLPSVEALIGRIGEETQSGALQPDRQRPMLSMIRDGGVSCRACSPASKSPLKSASAWRSFAAEFPAPAGSTRKTTT